MGAAQDDEYACVPPEFPLAPVTDGVSLVFLTPLGSAMGQRLGSP